MNKCKKIIISILYVFIFVSFMTVAHASEDIVNVNIINDLFDNVIQIANIIMVVLNFIFVIFVFYKEKKDDKVEKIKKYDEYWYNKYIVDNNISILDQFFKKLKTNVSSICSNIRERNNDTKEFDTLGYTKMVFEEWTKLHNECKSEFCEKIDVVIPEFGSELRNDFSKLQDYVSNKFNELILCQDNEEVNSIETEMNDVLNNSKKMFIKKIYLEGKPSEK